MDILAQLIEKVSYFKKHYLYNDIIKKTFTSYINIIKKNRINSYNAFIILLTKRAYYPSKVISPLH
jgi:hypothetical protein